jgi:CRP-like cAMP-binding protein
MDTRRPPGCKVIGVADGSAAGAVGAMLVPAERVRSGGPTPLFQGLASAEISRVTEAGTRKVLYRGTTLFKQGSAQDGIYLVETGRIKVFYVGPSKREITLAYWHPGNFVGGPDVFNKNVHIWSGVAAVNSSVLHLPGDALREMVKKIPTLAVNVIEGLSFKGRCYSVLAQMLATHSSTGRLAHLLLQLMDIYGVEEKRGVLIAAPFTHADLAHMIGVTRQWVTTAVKRLSENGVLDAHGANILIKNSAALTRMRDSRTDKGDLPQIP